jgi:tetratricopeptide (TPR) repeat protein
MLHPLGGAHFLNFDTSSENFNLAKKLVNQIKSHRLKMEQGLSELKHLAKQHPDEAAIYFLIGEFLVKLTNWKYALNLLDELSSFTDNFYAKAMLLDPTYRINLRIKNFQRSLVILETLIAIWIDLRCKFNLQIHGAQKQNFAQSDRLENLLNILSQAASKGVVLFPFYGTLLGLTREKNLLGHDKDIDLATWTENISEVRHFLLNNGFEYYPMYDTVYTFRCTKTNTTYDVSVVRREPESRTFTTGFIDYDQGPDWLLLQKLSAFTLEEKTLLSKTIQYPAQADNLLTQLYGNDWDIPNKNWDRFLDEPRFCNSKLHNLYVKSELLTALQFGSYEKLGPLLEKCTGRYPADSVFNAAMTKINSVQW